MIDANKPPRFPPKRLPIKKAGMIAKVTNINGTKNDVDITDASLPKKDLILWMNVVMILIIGFPLLLPSRPFLRLYQDSSFLYESP